MASFHERKRQRTERFERYVKGWRLVTCGACDGSGRYDHNGTPKCGCCSGAGRVRKLHKS